MRILIELFFLICTTSWILAQCPNNQPPVAPSCNNCAKPFLCVRNQVCCRPENLCPGPATDNCSPFQPCAGGLTCTSDGICCPSTCPSGTTDTGVSCQGNANLCFPPSTCQGGRCCTPSGGCPPGQASAGQCIVTSNPAKISCPEDFTCTPTSTPGVGNCCGTFN